MKAIWHLWGMIFAAIVVPIFKAKLGIDVSNVHGIHGVIGVAGLVLGVLHWREMKVGDLLDRVKGLEEKLLAAGKAAALIMVALALGSVGGCTGIQQMSDADLATFVQSQARNDVGAGLILAAQADPARADQIKQDALVVKQCLDGPVTQLFTSTTNAAVGSTINEAIVLLKKQVAGIKSGPVIVAGIQLAYSSISASVQLPSLPTQTLGPRAKGAALAFISGTSQAIGDFAGGPK